MKKIIIGLIMSLLLCSVVSAGVVINEFMANPIDSEPANEWIELYYDGSGSVDLAGWYIDDSNDPGDSLTGVLTSTNRYIVFSGSQTGIGLVNTGSNTIYLYNSSDDLIDSVTYTSTTENVSIGRKYDGSSEWISFTTSTPNTTNNELPIAVATYSPQIVTVNTQVTLNGSGSSDDGNIVSYLWEQTSGPTVTLSNTSVQKPTFTPTETGSYVFKLTVTDDVGLSDDDTVAIDVEEAPPTPPGPAGNLSIVDLDVKVGGDSDKNINERYETGYRIKDEARPGDKVRFNIEIENMFSSSSDIQIENIEVIVTIDGIDDGDELDESADIDDLDAGDDDSVTLEFTIPTLVDEGDYDVIIEVEGEENGNDHWVRWELTLEVKKDKHEIIIDDADLIPSLIRCDRNPSLEIEVVNIGREDEDEVTIEITNAELGLSIEGEDIELEEGDDSDSVFEKTYRLKIDDKVKPGIYPITIKAHYDSRLGDEKTVDLTVEKCVDITTPLGKELVDVVIETPTITEPVSETKISFRETSGYLALLAIFFIILSGGVIFLIGAVLRKR